MLRWFVAAVGATALASCVMLAGDGATDRPGTMLALVALAALAGCRPVRIPRLRIEAIPTHPFVLIAIAALGTFAGLLVAVTGVLAAAFAKQRTSSPLRIVLNFGAVTLATCAAAGTFALAGGTAGAPAGRLVWPLAAAAAAYFVANTGIVAVAIALDSRRGAIATWWRSMSWNVWSCAGGALIAAAGLALMQRSPAWGLALAALPCGFLLCLYRALARDYGGASVAEIHGASRSAMASAATAAPASFQCGSFSKQVGNTSVSRNVSSNE